MSTQEAASGEARFELSHRGMRYVVTPDRTLVNGKVVPLTPAQALLIFAITEQRGGRITNVALRDRMQSRSGDANNLVKTQLSVSRRKLRRTRKGAERIIVRQDHHVCRMPAEFYVEPIPAPEARFSFAHEGRPVVLLADGRILAHGYELGATDLESRAFGCLAERAGSVCTKQMFLDDLYGSGNPHPPASKIVDVLVSHLRKKLFEVAGIPRESFIQTRWGRGYVLVTDAASEAMAPGAPSLDLPDRAGRWTAAEKEGAAEQLLRGLITTDQLRAACPDMSEAEIAELLRKFEAGGRGALEVAAIGR